jgi:hypothetical protein
VGLVAAYADLALVDGVAVPWLDAADFSIADSKIDAAPGAAIGTGAWYVLEIHVLTSDKKCSRPGVIKTLSGNKNFDDYRWVRSLDLCDRQGMDQYRARSG